MQRATIPLVMEEAALPASRRTARRRTVDVRSEAAEAGGVLVEFPQADPELVTLGRRLRAARDGRGLSLDQLARAAETSRLSLALAEQGRARLGSAELHRVTNALRLPLAFLMADRADLSALRPFR